MSRSRQRSPAYRLRRFANKSARRARRMALGAVFPPDVVAAHDALGLDEGQEYTHGYVPGAHS